jgi:hypothetical protein
LVLRKFCLSRDVSWERSLSLAHEFIESECIVTVDGFLLFFDKSEMEVDKPSFIMHLENVNLFIAAVI